MKTRSNSIKPGEMGSQQIEKLFKQMEQKIEARFDKTNDSIESLREQMTQIHAELGTIKDLQNSLEFTQDNVAEIQKDLTVIKGNVYKVEHRMDALESRSDCNSELKEQYLNLSTCSRKENLKFSGIPEEDGERNNSTIAKVRDVFTNKLGITNASEIKFQRCHRMGRPSNTMKNPRDIIARFVLFPDREEVWKRRNKLKNSGISMSEDFPPEIVKRRAKLYPIYKLAKNKNYKCRMPIDKLIIEGVSYTVDNLDTLPNELHPKRLAERYLDHAVLFYGKESCFSNFYQADFVLQGKNFNSSQQFFLYNKVLAAGKDEVASKILKSSDTVEQYYLAKNIIPDASKWTDKQAKEIMEIGIRAKFDQNDQLKLKLLNTGEKMLIECNPYEKYWSCGLRINDPQVGDQSKWNGINVLGNILSTVRQSLKGS